MQNQKYFHLLFYLIFFLILSAHASTITLDPAFSYLNVKYWDTENGQWVYDYGAYGLGRWDGSASSYSNTDIYRSVYEFDLSQIPDNATINSVRLMGQIQGYSVFTYQGRLVGIPYNTFPDPQPLWDAVGSSTTIYVGGIDYDQAFSELSEALRSVIQSNLGVDIIKVGLLSLDEDQNETHGHLSDFQIEVDYSVPIDVTITTSPEGLQFSVDGQNYTASQTFGWWAGDEHTIGTTTPQTYNNTNYAFQNWSDGGAIIHQITPTSNQTITANFAEVVTVHITVKNRRDGGFVKVDNDQWSSGKEFDFDQGSTHDFEAWEQNYGGYDMVFKPGEEKWDTPDGLFYTALIDNHAVQNSGTIEHCYGEYVILLLITTLSTVAAAERLR